MRRRRPFRAPLWFHVALASLWVTVCHLLDLHALEAGPVQQAFLGWLIALGEIIWGGIQAVSTAVVAYLAWAVNALFFLGQLAYNALIELGAVAMKGIRQAWRFFRWTYDDILKPAWVKFWKLVDVVRGTLERVLRPVFAILRRIRDEILHLYATWIRPVLDTIDTARQMLRVLSALHLKFAATLDAKLGALEAAIDRPFRFVLEQLNGLINIVNRIVTLDGALQRLLFLKTIERDATYLVRLWWNAQIAKAKEPEPGLRGAEELPRVPPDQIASNLTAFYSTGRGAYADKIAELEPMWQRASGDAIGDAADAA